ncbi:WD repeat and coiled-coil-containing protein isoform X1 [Electrophorus electricus]|uniref:WD repeat and coiled-coil-containing protein isoform X1 n=2 Tax=Electrophorus electricus TaxID=8005 RepID=UPI0015D0CFC2|nr:WD repeat and coiled-coil-containing protein isoform X1 [Electrophorus electricus]
MTIVNCRNAEGTRKQYCKSMDLGEVKLLRTGLNSLQAIHPVHGIAWTDGKQVCLTSFCYISGEVKFGDTNVIGQFEDVFGLFWGRMCCHGSLALLAVQHKKQVTVLQLQQSALEQNKLLCAQTCELNEPFPLLSQGCVWHPRLDILAILTKRDVSVLFSVCVDNRHVKADIQGSGLVRCACWTKDGMRLVVAIGSALHSYTWNDIQKSLVACSFCPIFDVGDNICSIESIDDAQIVVTTELPLDKICGLNAGIAFDMPAMSEPASSQHLPVMTLGGDADLESQRRSFDSEQLQPQGFLSSSGPIDLTEILAKHKKSDPSPLIHLHRRDNMTGSGQDSSHLILVRYEHKVTSTRKVSIPGILVPDILAFDPKGNTVVVASNSCSTILIYSITELSVSNIQQIHLQKNEKPKGLCFISSNMILLALGQQRSNDPVFLPSSNTDQYNLRLVARELVFSEDNASSVSDSPSNLHGLWRHSENYSKPLALKDLVLPEGSINVPPSSRRKLIEEMQSPEVSLVPSSDRAASSTSSITVETYDMDHVTRMATLVAGQISRESSQPCSPRYEVSEKLLSDPSPHKNSNLMKQKDLEELKHNIERILVQFSEVQQCLSEIRDFDWNGKKSMGCYPFACEPQYVHVTCQKLLSENVHTDEKRVVLLCEGRLRLRALQEIFNLPMVEMKHGSVWIVLVADADGFVPLTFKHKEALMVRNAKRKCPCKPVGSTDDLSPELSKSCSMAQ